MRFCFGSISNATFTMLSNDCTGTWKRIKRHGCDDDHLGLHSIKNADVIRILYAHIDSYVADLAFGTISGTQHTLASKGFCRGTKSVARCAYAVELRTEL